MEISQLKILEFIHVLIFQAQEGRVSLCGCPMSLQKIHNHREAPLALVDAKQNVLSDLHELQQENSLSTWLDVDIGQVWMTAIGENSKSPCMNSVSWFTSSQPYQNACFTPNCSSLIFHLWMYAHTHAWKIFQHLKDYPFCSRRRLAQTLTKYEGSHSPLITSWLSLWASLTAVTVGHANERSAPHSE